APVTAVSDVTPTARPRRIPSVVVLLFLMIDLSEVVLLSLHSPLATRSDTGVLLDRTAFCFWGLLQYRNRARPVNPDRRSSARDRANRDRSPTRSSAETEREPALCR